MKHIFILFFALLFISCEETETVYVYPDGITKPDKIIVSRGCGNIFVYQFLDSTKALTVGINTNEIKLTKKRQVFDISISNPNIKVVIEVAANHPDSIYFNFCNDVGYPNEGVTKKYMAVSGRLSFSVSEDNPIKEPVWNTFYYVTIKVENLRLVNQETNDEINIDEAIFWNVGVGWAPG
ncbi:MAG: hypothetical protein IPM56_17945 [Ignavibacteriales bacterium]|nr:MAG: hypothetical protein IPM56_17945 [Ignavibacteriales bacterium]